MWSTDQITSFWVFFLLLGLLVFIQGRRWIWFVAGCPRCWRDEDGRLRKWRRLVVWNINWWDGFFRERKQLTWMICFAQHISKIHPNILVVWNINSIFPYIALRISQSQMTLVFLNHQPDDILFFRDRVPIYLGFHHSIVHDFWNILKSPSMAGQFRKYSIWD